MNYSPAGTAEAVDAAEVVVGAWPASAAITLDLGATSMLRHLAVALSQNHLVWDFEYLGKHPSDAESTGRILPGLTRNRGVHNALVHTMTVADAESLLAALSDAIDEVTQSPDDYREDNR